MRIYKNVGKKNLITSLYYAGHFKYMYLQHTVNNYMYMYMYM